MFINNKYSHHIIYSCITHLGIVTAVRIGYYITNEVITKKHFAELCNYLFTQPLNTKHVLQKTDVTFKVVNSCDFSDLIISGCVHHGEPHLQSSEAEKA